MTTDPREGRETRRRKDEEEEEEEEGREEIEAAAEEEASLYGQPRSGTMAGPRIFFWPLGKKFYR